MYLSFYISIYLYINISYIYLYIFPFFLPISIYFYLSIQKSSFSMSVSIFLPSLLSRASKNSFWVSDPFSKLRAKPLLGLQHPFVLKMPPYIYPPPPKPSSIYLSIYLPKDLSLILFDWCLCEYWSPFGSISIHEWVRRFRISTTAATISLKTLVCHRYTHRHTHLNTQTHALTLTNTDRERRW